MLLDHSKLDAFFLLNLTLQLLCKLFIGFICHDGKRVDLKSMNPLAILIDTDSKTTANFLPFFNNRICFVEGTDLEDVGIVPAFFQCGMGKDKLQF